MSANSNTIVAYIGGITFPSVISVEGKVKLQ
jgi:hypothetical protein